MFRRTNTRNAYIPMVKAISLIAMIWLFALSSCSAQEQQSAQASQRLDQAAVAGLKGATVWAIHQDRASNYWFATREHGVYQYDGQRLLHFTTQDGLVSNDIRGIQDDKQGNVFFDSDQGVSRFDGQRFETLPIANGEAPSDQWALNPNDLWFRIGFTSDGVYRYDGDSLHFLKLPKAPEEDRFRAINPNASYKPYGLYTIFKDRSGGLWFGTASLGVCHFNGEDFLWHYEDQLQTASNGGDFGTRTVFEDRTGRYWINNTRFCYTLEEAPDGSLSLAKEPGVGYRTESGSMKHPYFLSMAEDNKGHLWMVTYEDGIWEYDRAKLTQHWINDSESPALLFSILKDRDGALWVGSQGSGVYRYDGKAFRPLF